MLPPPPRSTLFPYTTLFRSGGSTDLGVAATARITPHDGPAATFLARPARADERFPNSVWAHSKLYARLCVARASGEAEDRKSTRLNSSHSSISYAVFCLKKK